MNYARKIKMQTLNKHERLFWDNFHKLLFDDPEDPLNDLIEQLRNTAMKYFKGRKQVISEGKNWQPCNEFKRVSENLDECICGHPMLSHEQFKNFKEL